jgi:hypothetical protein
MLPTRCSIIDIGTMGATRDICQLARRPAAVVINAAPIRSRVVQETTDAMTALGLLVCDTVTVVIWGARLLGAAVMMALLFLWTAGWL